MAPNDLLHAANTVVGILGVASANPLIAGAASGLSAAFSMKEIWHRLTGQTGSMADRISADLTAELALHHLPTQTRLLILQMIAKAELTPAEIMSAARDPRQISARMLAKMEDPAHKTPKARDGFERVVGALLARHLADPATSDALRPAFDDAIAASLQHIGQQVEYLVARARDDAHRLGVQEGMLISLARRYVPDDPASFDAALKGLEVALETAARMNAREATPQNSGAEAGRVIAEVNRLNALDKMPEADAAIAAAERALDAKAAEIDAQRALLHTLGLDQARLLGAPERAADRIIADLTRQAPAVGLFRAIHAAWEEWFDRGYEKGVTFDLTTALHLARANLDRSKGIQRTQALADLGITQYRLGEREAGTTRLTQSIATFRTFLTEHPRKSDPLTWATGKGNLAVALETLGARDTGTARLEEAVTAYRSALEVQTRDRVPLNWAGTQNNLGGALRTLGERETGTARLEEAVTAFRAALEEWTRDRVPLDWAMTENNLGNALHTLGERETGTARLEEAVTAYRAALLERTRDRVPLDWAATQNNLSCTLTKLGEREPGTARLEEAVTTCRAALEERTRDRVPLDWAMTQNNLGTALRTLGEREPGTARLEEAIAACRAALEEQTRDRVPLDWAASWGNMGEAMTVLADRTDDLAMARQALQQLQGAEAVLRDGGHFTFADSMADRIPRVEAVIARLS
jgi:tetratricopeptide (TPR) repeat protein